MCSGSEAGSYSRLIESLNSRLESNKEERRGARTHRLPVGLDEKLRVVHALGARRENHVLPDC